MQSALQMIVFNAEELRTRLRVMPDEKFRQFGEAARYMVAKLGKRTQSARLIHQFISLENGSLLAGRARQALASFRKFWLDRRERVERASQRPWWNFAICKMRPAFGKLRTHCGMFAPHYGPTVYELPALPDACQM
jgi:hypothetical protein